MDIKTNPAIHPDVENAGRVADANPARLVDTLIQPDHARPQAFPPAAKSVACICETWPQRVRAAECTDLNSLDAIDAWVRELRADGQLQPGVRFTVEDDPGLPGGVLRGVLYDPNTDPLHRWVVLRRGQYLIHRGDKKLEVLDEHTFHTCYRYLDQGQRRSG